MANQSGVITLSGKLDKQVYFRRNGKNFARTAPEHVQLSENSKKSSKEFGRASSAASLVRQAFSFIVNPIADKAFSQRLRSCFVKVISSAYSKPNGEREVTDGDLALLKGFQFNRYTRLWNIFSIEPLVEINPETGISITVPGFRLAGTVNAPPGAVTLVIQLCCCACDFPAKNGLLARADDLQINLDKPFFPGGTISFPGEATDSKVLLVATGAYFLNSAGMLTANRNWMAGSIIEAGMVREGHIVPFQPLEKKISPVDKPEQKKRVSWQINEE